MSTDVIQVEYLGRITPIKKAPTLDEFISQLVYTFFLTENMKNNLSLKYIDDDGDEITVENDNDEYESLSNDKKLFLSIAEKENPANEENIVIDVNKNVQKMKNDFKAYKKKLVEIYQKAIKQKLKEVDQKHQKELEDIKEKYETCLKDIKVKTQIQINELLKKVEQKCDEIMNNKLVEYNQYIEKELSEVMSKIDNLLENKDKEVNFDILENKQNEVSQVLENNQKELDKAINN